MEHWYRRGALAWLLWPASLAFGVAAWLRRRYLRAVSRHPGIPVIVVGNITVGGSGKTPLVLWLAEALARGGSRPAVVSRGYGGVRSTPRAVSPTSDPAEAGDEPVLLARRSRCPVWVGADRLAVIVALRAAHPEVDVVVLDDGLQHYRLARDLEIAVVDARGFGNGFLLPAGPLREPRSRLASVDAVVSHEAPLSGFRMRLAGEVLHRTTDAADRRAASAFAGVRVHAVAGIGDPSRFFRHLRELGFDVEPHPFPDHHRFAPGDLAFGDARPVVMTEKDAVKLRPAAQPHWWVLPVSAELEPAFAEWLSGRLDGIRRRSKAA